MSFILNLDTNNLIVIRLNQYLNLLMEVKTSALVVWQQLVSSTAQRIEDRRVLIVSLSVACKSKRDFITSKQIYNTEAETHQCLNRNLQNPRFVKQHH